MVYKIQKVNDEKLEKVYKRSIKELNEFFNLKWQENLPRLILVTDRKTIDTLRRYKTEPWLVGWANNENIYILDYINYERESNHKYSDKEYFGLIKHELAHSFTDKITNNLQKPIWLLEGLALYLDGRNDPNKKPKKFKNFIKHYDKFNFEVYKESGYAIQFLVKKYGKNKLIKLLKESKNIDSSKDFAKLFKRMYGFDLNYKNFNI